MSSQQFSNKKYKERVETPEGALGLLRSATALVNEMESGNEENDVG